MIDWALAQTASVDLIVKLLNMVAIMVLVPYLLWSVRSLTDFILSLALGVALMVWARRSI